MNPGEVEGAGGEGISRGISMTREEENNVKGETLDAVGGGLRFEW